ncbi:MAG TPA: hypothetical protein VGO69_01205, partial [Pyrinomonadaceae bacterium]|nr:hypothetical protein [Pyrinomonadaceae bacterium]
MRDVVIDKLRELLWIISSARPRRDMNLQPAVDRDATHTTTALIRAYCVRLKNRQTWLRIMEASALDWRGLESSARSDEARRLW